MNCYIETLSLTKSLLSDEIVCRVADPSILPGCEHKPDFSGRQTNVTPTKYILWTLAQRQELLDRIVVVVDDACMDEREAALGGQTTYEYYLAETKAYLEKLCEEHEFLKEELQHRWGSLAGYIEEVFLPVRVPKKVDTQNWAEVVHKIMDHTGNDDSVNLYFDFTGGSRVASLVSLLLLKVIEVGHAKVRQVIYVEKNGPEKIIIDCTDNYEILTSIERIAMAKASQQDSTSRVIRELKTLGLATDADLVGMAVIDRLRAKDQATLDRKEASEIQRSGEQFRNSFNASSALVRGVGEKAVDRLKQDSRRSAFSKLSEDRKTAAKLILEFHEAIIMVLIDYGIFEYVGQLKGEEQQKKYVSDALKANDYYFSRSFPIKHRGKYETAERGVISEVRKWLERLQQNPQYTPEKTMARQMNVSLREYDEAVWFAKYIKGFTGRLTKEFEDYLKGMPLQIKTESGAERVSWQRVYYNYGFPFMCLGDWAFPEIQEYYLKKALSLMETLGELQRSDEKAYQETLRLLLANQKEVEKRIPYMTEFSFLKLSEELFESREKADAFLQTFCARLEEVRPYRNAIAHKLKNAYSKPEAQEEEAKRIRAWLAEYDALFT